MRLVMISASRPARRPPCNRQGEAGGAKEKVRNRKASSAPAQTAPFFLYRYYPPDTPLRIRGEHDCTIKTELF